MNEPAHVSRLTVSMPMEMRSRVRALADEMDVAESAIVKMGLNRLFRGYGPKSAPVALPEHATPNTPTPPVH